MQQQPLTPKQEAFFRWLVRFQQRHGYVPTYQEAMAGFGLKSKAQVSHYLQQLQAKGYVQRKAGSPRGIALGSRAFTVPFRGYVSAGKGIDFADVGSEQIELTGDLISPHHGVFAVAVKGDSMVDALIRDGDLLLVAETPRVENGQLAVIRMPSALFPEGETTCKRFYQKGALVELRAENPHYAPLHFPAQQVEVQGRVVGVIRSELWGNFGSAA